MDPPAGRHGQRRFEQPKAANHTGIKTGFTRCTFTTFYRESKPKPNSKQSGRIFTRWLAARVADRLPDALALGTLHGSLLDGLRLESIEWNSEGLRLAANEVELAFELLPLARRQLNIDSLTVERLQLEISETTGSGSITYH